MADVRQRIREALMRSIAEQRRLAGPTQRVTDPGMQRVFDSIGEQERLAAQVSETQAQHEYKYRNDATTSENRAERRRLLMNEQGAFERAVSEGKIDDPQLIETVRAHQSVPLSERQTALEYLQSRQQGKRYEQDMLRVNIPEYDVPEYLADPVNAPFPRAWTPRDEAGQLVPPKTPEERKRLADFHLSVSEVEPPTAEEIQEAIDLQKELTRQSQENASQVAAPLGRPRPERMSDADVTNEVRIRTGQTILSDEKGKKNIKSSVPEGAAPSSGLATFSPTIGKLDPKALHVDPDGGRIDADDPRNYYEGTYAARTPSMSQYGARGPAEVASVNLGPAYQDEVREAVAARSGLASADPLQRRRRIMELIGYQQSLPEFEMVDVGGRYRG